MAILLAFLVQGSAIASGIQCQFLDWMAFQAKAPEALGQSAETEHLTSELAAIRCVVWTKAIARSAVSLLPLVASHKATTLQHLLKSGFRFSIKAVKASLAAGAVSMRPKLAPSSAIWALIAPC